VRISDTTRTRSVAAILAPYCLFVFIAALLHVSISYGQVYLLHIALVALLLRAALIASENDRVGVTRPQGAMELCAAAFVAMYTLSWVWSIDHLHAVPYLGYMFIGVTITLATALLCSSREGLVRLLRVAAIIEVIHIVICMLEIFTPFRLPVSPFSHYASLFGRTDKLETLEATDAILQQLLRSPTGFHWNPNNLAVAMVIVLGFVINVRRPFWRWTGVISIITIIAYTASRASVIGILVVFAVYILVLSHRRLAVTLASIPVAVLVLWIVISNVNAVYDRIAPVLGAVEAAQELFESRKTQSDSIEIRQQLMSNSLGSIRQRIGVGVGPGGSILVQQSAGGEAAQIGSSHNFWLEIAVDGGVLALLFFVTWYAFAWISCVVVALYSSDAVFSYVGKSLACSMAGFSVALVSASSVLYFPPMWVMFGAVIGLRRARHAEHRQRVDAAAGLPGTEAWASIVR
jgi:teichuronic acid biosynthesis protein TuaE